MRSCFLGVLIARHALAVGALLASVAPSDGSDRGPEPRRDPFKQPFASNSIWNTPIGDAARYEHARLEGGDASGMTVDEDLIVLRPDAPSLTVRYNDAGWDRDKSRCTTDGEVLFHAPIPDDFLVGPHNWDGSTPNSGLAVLMEDGRTIRQTQPFARCRPDRDATSMFLVDDVDLYGDGVSGSHGGSGLSVIGGSLRLGELRPGGAAIRHALKVNVYAARNLYYDDKTRGYRWPALRADSYAKGNYGTQRSATPVAACRMGALLALPADVEIDDLGLETEPAIAIAHALQDYGAYVVDDTAWDVFAIACEWSPDGRFIEQFQSDWGFPFITADRQHPWSKDMRRLFYSLHVVDNNVPSTPGGGGSPRQPPAPPLAAPALSARPGSGPQASGP
ncbi:MAG: hypothetical protein AAFV43_15100 [Planctomycetota bacterium]